VLCLETGGVATIVLSLEKEMSSQAEVGEPESFADMIGQNKLLCSGRFVLGTLLSCLSALFHADVQSCIFFWIQVPNSAPFAPV
jgi:hypothetical protein